MADYRLYFVGPTGRITQRVDLKCEDDAQAIRDAQAQFIATGASLELWQGSRKVKVFTADK